MIIFSVITAIFWIFFMFYQLNGNTKFAGLRIFGFNLVYGFLILLFFDYFKPNITYLIFGFIIMISGLRFLAILDKDLFYWGEIKFSGHRLLVRQLPLFSCWLGFVGQSNMELLMKLISLLILNIILAGFLQLGILRVTRIKSLGWRKELSVTLTGLFIIINSLIIMSGDVEFFLHILEKILYIN